MPMWVTADEIAAGMPAAQRRIIEWVHVAAANRDHGLIGVRQGQTSRVFAADLVSGTSWPLASVTAAACLCTLTGDGRHVVFFDGDAHAGPLGRMCCVCFDGSNAHEIDCGRPAREWRKFGWITGLCCDESTKLIVVSAHNAGLAQRCKLLAFAAADGTCVAEVWDGPNTHVSLAAFAPRAGDLRLAGSSDYRGKLRPFIWNLATGERFDLDLPEFAHDVRVLDWSATGQNVLLCHAARKPTLHLFNLTTHVLSDFIVSDGLGRCAANSATRFVSEHELLVREQCATRSDRLVVLNANTGAVVRVVLDAATL